MSSGVTQAWRSPKANAYLVAVISLTTGTIGFEACRRLLLPPSRLRFKERSTFSSPRSFREDNTPFLSQPDAMRQRRWLMAERCAGAVWVALFASA